MASLPTLGGDSYEARMVDCPFGRDCDCDDVPLSSAMPLRSIMAEPSMLRRTTTCTPRCVSSYGQTCVSSGRIRRCRALVTVSAGTTRGYWGSPGYTVGAAAVAASAPAAINPPGYDAYAAYGGRDYGNFGAGTYRRTGELYAATVQTTRVGARYLAVAARDTTGRWSQYPTRDEYSRGYIAPGYVGLRPAVQPVAGYRLLLKAINREIGSTRGGSLCRACAAFHHPHAPAPRSRAAGCLRRAGCTVFDS